MFQKIKQSKGFTLIELMIVVAIIGILAAIAIPNFVEMQLRSKRAELPTNVEAIRTAEMAYFNQYDGFVSCAAQGNTGLAAQPQPFGSTAGTGWKSIGWEPDGNVYAGYEATDQAAQPPDFAVIAIADIDQDTNTFYVTGSRYTKPTNSDNTLY